MAQHKVDLSRRDLMKTTGLGAAFVAAASVLPEQAGAQDALSAQYAMVIDVRRCIGCQACSVACKSEFAVPIGKTRSWVEYVEKGIYPDVARTFLPRLCNHCTKPACVPVCPTGATFKRKEDGIVVVDADKCIGCGYCVLACPYNARFINPLTNTADKCDLHRVKQGIAPSCVNTCQGKARIFGDMNDPESEVAKLIASEPVTVLRQEMGTEPNVYYIAADHADPGDVRYQEQYIRVDTHRQVKERI